MSCSRTRSTHACEPGTAVASLDSSDPLDVEQARLFEELGCAHAVVTPPSVRRTVLGAMTWVRNDPAQPFSEQEELLAAEIGRRAGVALDDARLYGQQRAAAVALQRSLLTVLPEPDHLQITARSLPASDGVEIGGHWYDAFVLDDGATSIVIGDILGHDLTAAAYMGQVRNLLRGIAADRLQPPSDVVSRPDRALDSLQVGALATCLWLGSNSHRSWCRQGFARCAGRTRATCRPSWSARTVRSDCSRSPAT